jgi:flagellar hook-associated protein 3 FlgL
MTTGKRHATISGDPVAGRQVIEIDTGLRAIDQQRRAVSSNRLRLATEEDVLQQVTDILARVKELATGQGSDTASASTRAATAAEVRSLREQVISLGNTQVGGEFLFAGMATLTPPFLPDGSYVGTPTARQSTLGPTVHSGQQLIVDTGVLTTLADLETALLSNDAAAIRATIYPLDAGFDDVQTFIAEIGSRTNGLDFVAESLDQREDTLTTRRRELADIPIEEATLALASAQSALEAAYLAAARIQSLTLSEYLR